MAFDGQISSEVSLARVLDEMIVDDTDFNVIMEFLNTHKDDLDYIFRNSVFAFELFDIATHPNLRVDYGLIKWIEHLDRHSMFYALGGLGLSPALSESMKYEVKRLKASHKDELRSLNLLYAWFEYDTDVRIANGEVDLVEFLNGIGTDLTRIRRFLRGSVFTKSVFMAKTFLRLDVGTKVTVLATIGDESEYNPLVYSLIKQCLIIGDIDTVNSIFMVLNSGNEYVPKMEIRECARRGIPDNLLYDKNGEIKPFEEIVFDMPFHQDEFEPLDLFMFGYLNDFLIQKIIEFPELVDEQFNLSFDWRLLGKFNGRLN